MHPTSSHFHHNIKFLIFSPCNIHFPFFLPEYSHVLHSVSFLCLPVLPPLISHIHSCLNQTGRSGSLLLFPIICVFHSSVSPPPLLLSILSAAGLITACHKCLTVAQKVPAAPREPKTWRWLEGRNMPWKTAFAGKWRNTHLRRERDRDTYIAAKRESSTSLFHLSFDWTVIVMCGPHCNPGKGRGINKWCNYKRLMWHKGREAGQEKASGGAVCRCY